MADYHTTLDFLLVDTAEEETYVVTSFTLIEELTEHLDTGNGRLEVCTEAHDLNFVAYLNHAGFDTTGGNGTTAGDGEDVFNRHQEGFVDVAGGRGIQLSTASMSSITLASHWGSPLRGAEGRTADDRSFVAVILVGREKFAHFHFNEVENLFVVDEVALVEEHNDTGERSPDGREGCARGVWGMGPSVPATTMIAPSI